MRGTEQAEQLAKSAAERFKYAGVRYGQQYQSSFLGRGPLSENDPESPEARQRRLEAWGNDVQAEGLAQLAEAVSLLAVAIRQTYDKISQQRR